MPTGDNVSGELRAFYNSVFLPAAIEGATTSELFSDLRAAYEQAGVPFDVNAADVSALRSIAAADVGASYRLGDAVEQYRQTGVDSSLDFGFVSFGIGSPEQYDWAGSPSTLARIAYRTPDGELAWYSKYLDPTSLPQTAGELWDFMSGSFVADDYQGNFTGGITMIAR